MASKLKTSFKKARTIAPLHTSGPVAVTQDGSRIVTCVAEEALLTEVHTGTEICRFAGDTQSITALCVTPSGKHLILFTSSLSLRIYELPIDLTHLTKPIQPIRIVGRAHEAPVHVCVADPTSTYLASGAADGVVKVWDIAHGHMTHIFKGHGGVVSALTFSFPRNPAAVARGEVKMRLFTASVDTKVRMFDLEAAAARTAGASKPEAVLEGHVSVPRALDVSQDGRWLVSGGRDSVALVWDLKGSDAENAKLKGSSKGKGAELPLLVKTIPVLERVEAAGLLHTDEDLPGSSADANSLRIFTAGEKGVVKIWNAKTGAVLFTLGDEQLAVSEDEEEQRQILQAIYNPTTSTIISIHADQNILFHSLTKRLTRQLIGFNDEIVDATFLSLPTETDSHIALATNSSLIRIYTADEGDARLLHGHKDIVLCLDRTKGGVLGSGSKDRSARVWVPIVGSEEGDWGWVCVGVCEGHAESIGAIALSRAEGRKRFMCTGSQDRTIKIWDLSAVPLSSTSTKQEVVKCKSLFTHRAHEKDINALDISPDDQLLASGSQDRTAKIYLLSPSSPSSPLKELGVCKGHKRGVWSVRFSPSSSSPPSLLTGSGDKTIRMWSLDDFSCLRTFEGHTNSVLRVLGMGGGAQVVSCASDGLVKVWDVRGEECVATLDGHEDKVWALSISTDEQTLLSGSADSLLNIWTDNTSALALEQESARSLAVTQEQDFQNYLHLADYRRAIELALALKQPGRLYSLFKNLPQEGGWTGSREVDEVLRKLSLLDLAMLLKFIRDWNAKASSAGIAQRVLRGLIKLRPASDFTLAFDASPALDSTFGTNALDSNPAGLEGGAAKAGGGLKEIIESLIPYTERHLARMDRLVQESYVVDYVLGEMDAIGLLDSEQISEESEKGVVDHEMEIEVDRNVGVEA